MEWNVKWNLKVNFRGKWFTDGLNNAKSIKVYALCSAFLGRHFSDFLKGYRDCSNWDQAAAEPHWQPGEGGAGQEEHHPGLDRAEEWVTKVSPNKVSRLPFTNIKFSEFWTCMVWPPLHHFLSSRRAPHTAPWTSATPPQSLPCLVLVLSLWGSCLGLSVFHGLNIRWVLGIINLISRKTRQYGNTTPF